MQQIVVGIDDSPAAMRALQWALSQAVATGAEVDVVHAWDVPASYGVGPTVLEGEDLAGSAEQWLAATVDEITSEFPGVRIHRRTVRGHPAAVLLQQATGADLLVVGSHGRAGFLRALLGSVSMHCVSHATCPVVVVRSGS